MEGNEHQFRTGWEQVNNEQFTELEIPVVYDTADFFFTWQTNLPFMFQDQSII